MKVQTDMITGVYEVNEFDQATTVEDQDTFCDWLERLDGDDKMAADLDAEMVAKIKDEYGIKMLRGGNRPGAGAPKKSEWLKKRQIGLQLPSWIIDKLDSLGGRRAGVSN